MRLAYADPPYPGCAYLYRNHPDYAGEVDYPALIHHLETFDGWVLHTNSVSIPQVAPLIPAGARWMAWVKPFAAFKRNVSVAYAWEPIIVKAARKPVVNHRVVMRDWIAEPITLKRGLTGVKPDAVARWAFEMMGAVPDDELTDLFPGTCAITRAWGARGNPNFGHLDIAFHEEPGMSKPILCVDFDGVIHSYTSGWKGACEIPDLPVLGAFDWLYRASEWWQIAIYSSRSSEMGAIDAMQRWFRKHADNEFQGLVTGEMLLAVLTFPTTKPSAFLTIDDRALCFEGSWAAIDAKALLDFKPWNKRDFGATGQFPQGQVSDEDEGELKMGVAFDPVNGIVHLEFGKPIAWIGLPPDQAIALGNLLIDRARQA